MIEAAAVRPPVGLEVRLLAIPLTEPFAAAHGTTTERLVTVVRVLTADGHGWGECAALSEPTYSPEHAVGAFDALIHQLGPRLLQAGSGAATADGDGGDRATGFDPVLDQLLGPPAGHPMARAALEMGLLDAGLRAGSRPLAEWLGATAESVPAGVAVGLGRPEQVADRVDGLVAEGYGRVKLKITPGSDRAVVAVVRDRHPALELQVDGNGSFGDGHLDLLIALAELGVGALEQPFPANRPDLAAALVARLGPAGPLVVADEAATDQAAVLDLRQAGALTAVSVKPSRLGGLAAARRLHGACRDQGVPLTPGGMVETGLGRHALAAVAALPGFTLTGDVSPARRWLVDDPWPDLTLSRPGNKPGTVAVPQGPGVAPDPDPAVLDRFTVARAHLRP